VGDGITGIVQASYTYVKKSVSLPADSETKFDIEQWTLGNITKTHFVMPVGHNPTLGIFTFL
jgi:hypothetical protein